MQPARNLGAGIAGGALAGLLAGGIGGRLAMFILRLTSAPELHGLLTDDGFTIGSFTSETAFLLAFTTFFGVAGGLLYLVVRPWFPARRRAAAMGVSFGLVLGARVIRTDGIDFAVLDPLWLAIVLFLLVPALYGVVLSLAVERFLRERSVVQRWPLWVVAPLGLLLVPLLSIAEIGALLVVLFVVAWFVVHASPRLLTLWERSPVVAWIGRLVLALVAAASLVEIVRDSIEIL